MTIMANTFDQALEHVLHIGAGLCAQLPEYLAAGASSITLFEPDPETVVLLRAQTAQFPKVSVVEAAVSLNTEPQQLHRFSFADLNSLRAPTGLDSLFPALEVLGKDPVQVQNPVELVQGLQLSETGAHMLVLEAPGEAFSIMSALDEAGLLSLFRYLQINEGRDVLYEGATPLFEIRAWLETRYFSTNSQWDNADPARPVLTVTYDDLRAAQAELAIAEAQIETSQQALTAKSDAFDAQGKELETLQQTLADLTETHDAQTKEVEALQQTLADLTKAGEQHSDAQVRSQHQLALSREELLKAQGQITLIGDLLLRGPTL